MPQSLGWELCCSRSSQMGSKYYTTVDLLSGFWQTPMEESSKQYVAFTVGTLGFFQCECKPFGLCNVPATFQLLMTNLLGELNHSTCLVYLNDVVIYSSTQEEHQMVMSQPRMVPITLTEAQTLEV